MSTNYANNDSNVESDNVNNNNNVESRQSDNVNNDNNDERQPNTQPNSETEMQYEFIQGERRGSKLLLCEQQLYRKKDTYKGKQGYECVEKNCKQRVYVNSDGKCYTNKNFVGHDHANQDAHISKLMFLHAIKEECAMPANIVMKTKRVFNNLSAKLVLFRCTRIRK